MRDDCSGVTRRSLLATGALAVASGCVSMTGTDDHAAPATDEPPTSTLTPADTPTRTASTTTEPTTERPAPRVAPEHSGTYLQRGTVVDDLSDLSPWTGEGTVGADTDVFFEGDQSLSYDNRGRVVLNRTFEDALDLRDRSLSFAAWFEKPTTSRSTFTVFAHAPDRHNRVCMKLTYPATKEAGWQRYDLATTNVEGDPDLSTVTSLQFRSWADGKRFRFHLADLRTHPKPDCGKVVFRFDDGHEHHHSEYFPILDEYGYPGIEAVVEGNVGLEDRMNVSQLHDLRDAGWDLCSHTVGHENITELSTEELRANIERMDTFFEDIGAPEGKDLAIYTYGAYDGRTIDVMAEHFDLVFGGGGLGSYEVTNPAAIRGTDVDEGADRAIELVDDAAKGRSLAIPIVHHLPASEFRRVVEHVHDLDHAGHIDVVSASDLQAHLY